MTSDLSLRGRSGPRWYRISVGPSVRLRVQARVLWVTLALVLLALAACVASLTVGRLGIPLANLPSTLSGQGASIDAFVLDRLRGPRLVVALAAGAAFGLSGALFQSVTRNPLGSPDIIGIAPGAGAGAALVALLFPSVPVAFGALGGAVLAMGIVYVSTGTGFKSPSRLVIAGIAVTAMATAFIQYIVYAIERDQATVLSSYLNGSLTARAWSDAATAGVVLLVCVPFAWALSRPLTASEMGQDTAASLGADPRRTYTWSIVVSIALSAGAVTAAGPIAFIALTAPQIAKRVTRGTGPHLASSALTGALLLVLADMAAQNSPVFEKLPVGVWTMALGGLYLGRLLFAEWRRGIL
ncbi:iron chelate uptake ABC transporter family permease subunit [Streptomyces sp. SID14478]|uniref:FecCD family ABC transporter permease n=1 Tax=Streptomyces sp. SID14478 TaxID=2706073 RepID=UPI0013DF81A2|nr:iron chelate uptake ABC transporter family permease subunit [Streptomyces sp. SID14478]NEB81797.1 iron chelate uptake ABC transporter family permease subunit [Streptomyces sp. SID14478]